MDGKNYNSPLKNFSDISMAVNFVREKVTNFDDIPERIVPGFIITEEEIGYLEKCVLKTVKANCESSGVDMGNGYEQFLKKFVRIGLNSMLLNKDNPLMKWHLLKMRGKKDESPVSRREDWE